MILKFKYFGMVAETLGKDSEELDMDIRRVHELIELYRHQLKGINFKVAINQQIAEGDTPLYENDEVALLPPFAGG